MHTTPAAPAIKIVFLYKCCLNDTPELVPSESICIDSTGIIVVVLTAVCATAST